MRLYRMVPLRSVGGSDRPHVASRPRARVVGWLDIDERGFDEDIRGGIDLGSDVGDFEGQARIRTLGMELEASASGDVACIGGGDCDADECLVGNEPDEGGTRGNVFSTRVKVQRDLALELGIQRECIELFASPLDLDTVSREVAAGSRFVGACPGDGVVGLRPLVVARDLAELDRLAGPTPCVTAVDLRPRDGRASAPGGGLSRRETEADLWIFERCHDVPRTDASTDGHRKGGDGPADTTGDVDPLPRHDHADPWGACARPRVGGSGSGGARLGSAWRIGLEFEAEVARNRGCQAERDGDR